MSNVPLVVVGDGPVVALAESIGARTRGGRVRVERLTTDDIAQTTLGFIADADVAGTEVFAAIGIAALNFARFDLWAKFRLRGLRCATLVDPGADVDASARLADNVLVGAYATVGPSAMIASGSIVQAGAHVGAGATVGKFSWIGTGVTIGAGVKIGPHVVLGPGVHLQDGAELGGANEISVPGIYRGSVPYGTFIAPEFSTPVRLLRGEAPR